MAPRRKRSQNGNDDDTDMQGRLESLKADLEALQNDMKGFAGEVSGVAAERMNDALENAMEAVHDMAERVEGWGTDNLESVRDQVRNQPLASVLLSVGAGALLGALLLRR
jgi:ElaB/YqjD/DUF883 family membrane-anchored ribosome-binding protein